MGHDQGENLKYGHPRSRNQIERIADRKSRSYLIGPETNPGLALPTNGRTLFVYCHYNTEERSFGLPNGNTLTQMTISETRSKEQPAEVIYRENAQR